MFSLYLHDAVYMYALATDELFREGGDKRNGSRIFEIAKNKTFHGTGQFIIRRQTQNTKTFYACDISAIIISRGRSTREGNVFTLSVHQRGYPSLLSQVPSQSVFPGPFQEVLPMLVTGPVPGPTGMEGYPSQDRTGVTPPDMRVNDVMPWAVPLLR